jgi:kinesin light chain
LEFIFEQLLIHGCVGILHYRKKIEEIGEKTSPAMTQDEILSSTKTVVQGLETLRMEHHQVLNGLQASVNTIKNENVTASLIEEKISILKKSIEMIELAMGEAQVGRRLYL